MDGNCNFCGVQTKAFASSGRYKKYCSPLCNGRFKSARVSEKLIVERLTESATCPTCKSAFHVGHALRRYCSTKCRLQANNKRPEGITCDLCKTVFSTTQPNAKYCSRSCMAKATGVGSHHKRARKYNVPYEPISRLKVFERDGWKCQICRKKTPREMLGTQKHNAPQLDHRVPISRGGPHLYSNVQCACRACDMAKSNRASTGQGALFSQPGGFHA